MWKKILTLVFGVLGFLSAGGAQTVDLVWRYSGDPVAKSVIAELETGALDLFFSEGLIVTTAGTVLPIRDDDLRGMLSAADEGKAQWLLVFDVSLIPGARPTSPPESISYSLYRVRDGLRTLAGRMAAPRSTDPGFADPVKRMRATGKLAAKAVLSALHVREARLDDGIIQTALKGG